MLTGVLNNIRRERAKKARELEYIKEAAATMVEDDRLLQIDDRMVNADENEYEDLAEVIDQIELSEEEEDEEIDRILDADHDLSFEEMCGISK